MLLWFAFLVQSSAFILARFTYGEKLVHIIVCVCVCLYSEWMKNQQKRTSAGKFQSKQAHAWIGLRKKSARNKGKISLYSICLWQRLFAHRQNWMEENGAGRCRYASGTKPTLSYILYHIRYSYIVVILWCWIVFSSSLRYESNCEWNMKNVIWWSH